MSTECKMTTNIRHWMPIITFCPVNNLPDPLYISIEFDSFVELYGVRKRVRELVSLKNMFMEDVAKLVAAEYPQAVSVTVTLLFSRHVVKLYNNREE